LDLATAQAGGEAMVEEDIAVNDLVDDLTYVLETANKRKGLTLDFELEKAPGGNSLRSASAALDSDQSRAQCGQVHVLRLGFDRGAPLSAQR
jgi:hypothetical protein